MFALFFKTVRKQKKLLLRSSVSRLKRNHLRFAFRYSSSFIKRNYADFAGCLQRSCRLEKYSVFRRNSVTDHNRNRRCKSKRTRAAYHKNGNCTRKGKSCVFSQSAPHKERQHRHENYYRNKNCTYFICNACRRCFCCCGIAYHFYYLAERSIFSDALRTAFQKSVHIDGRGNYKITGLFVYRDAFSCNGSLIHRACSVNHSSVYGNAFSRMNDKNVAGTNFLNRNILLRTAALNADCFRRKIHKRFQRTGRFSL